MLPSLAAGGMKNDLTEVMGGVPMFIVVRGEKWMERMGGGGMVIRRKRSRKSDASFVDHAHISNQVA